MTWPVQGLRLLGWLGRRWRGTQPGAWTRAHAVAALRRSSGEASGSGVNRGSGGNARCSADASADVQQRRRTAGVYETGA